MPIKKPTAPKAPEPVKPEEKPAEGGENAPASEAQKEPVAVKPQESEQSFETQIKKRSRIEEINFDTQAHALPPNVRTEYRALEQKLHVGDRKFLDLKESKNSLEAYSYQIRDNLEGQYAPFMEDSVKAKFLADLKHVVEWLYTSEGENATLDQYQKHLKAFKDLGMPVKARFQYHENIGDFYKLFDNLTQKAQTKLSELAHLTDAQRETVIAKVGLANEFIQKVKEDLSTKPLW